MNKALKAFFRRARDEGRTVLLEHELFDLFEALGLAAPERRFIPRERIASGRIDLGPFAGRPVVLKLISRRIVHKSDLGGVVFADLLSASKLRTEVRAMIRRLPAQLAPTVEGVLIEERIASGPGRELFLGMRQTREFGPVYSVGFGGGSVEALDRAMRPDQATVVFQPGITSARRLRKRLDRSLFFPWFTGGVRGASATENRSALWASIGRWQRALEAIRRAACAEGLSVSALELNPLVWAGRWIPVDALLTLDPGEPGDADETPFPLGNLSRGLSPKRIAIAGVSARTTNVGRIILDNLRKSGFRTDRITVLRDDVARIGGVACAPSLAHLRGKVDLLVVAVRPSHVPELLEAAFAEGQVAAVLLIPETGDRAHAGAKMEEEFRRLVASRPDADRPAIIGNNSLGFVSEKARCDALFIPEEKLPRRPERGLDDIAIISQSGAFMVTRVSKLDFLRPRYQISVGNQLDARIPHFLQVLARDDRVRTFALYIEGLKRGDGLRLAELVQQICRARTPSGGPLREVILYRAGRSGLGKAAALGHTAQVAGDFRIFSALLGDAGALVAERFDDFVDLIRLSALIGRRRFSGRRIAMTSNAGFETVGMADNLEGERFALAPAVFSARTETRLKKALAAGGIDDLVRIANPLDLTPMADDSTHAACMEAVLDDPGVDAAVFGCVPLSPMVTGGFADRAIRLAKRSAKPFVVVVEGGRRFDPLVRRLEDGRVPVFRSADRAMRRLLAYLEHRLA